MSDSEQFEECLKRAQSIVAAYRAEAPEGCDPQNTWVATAIVAGSAISAGGAYLGQRSANRNRQQSFQNAQNYMTSLRGRGDDFLTAAFGDSLNPEAFLYEKVDLTQSQLDTISGNLKAFPSADKLVDRVNPEIWKNDQARIRNLMPGYDAAKDSYLGTMRNLQEGELPFSDVADIVAGRAGASGVLNTPGGARNATLRDLGLSRMDAMREGNSMFGQFVNISQQISPVEHQMRPQQMFFTPQERAQMDIQQAELDMMGRSQAELARAMPDPAQNALINAEMGIQMASLGNNSPSPWGPAMQALGSGITTLGGYYAGRQQGGATQSGWGAGGRPTGSWAQAAPTYTDYNFQGGAYRQTGQGFVANPPDRADFGRGLQNYTQPGQYQIR